MNTNKNEIFEVSCLLDADAGLCRLSRYVIASNQNEAMRMLSKWVRAKYINVVIYEVTARIVPLESSVLELV